jgi:hypothetical protein
VLSVEVAFGQGSGFGQGFLWQLVCLVEAEEELIGFLVQGLQEALECFWV